MNPRTTIPTTEARMLDTKAIIAEAENAAATAPIASKIIAPIPSGFSRTTFFFLRNFLLLTSVSGFSG